MSDDKQLIDILQNSQNIAVIGLSSDEEKASNRVARYLIDNGYTIFPVNPSETSILGLPCYPDLASIPEKIDIVDIFRRSEYILPIVQQAVAQNCRTVWMQLGIANAEAAAVATQNGLNVIQDKCIKIEHTRLFA